jgi:hypothetical protein
VAVRQPPAPASRDRRDGRCVGGRAEHPSLTQQRAPGAPKWARKPRSGAQEIAHTSWYLFHGGGGRVISYQVNALRLRKGKVGSHLRAPPAKLHQDPLLPTTPYICPLRPISPSFPALTPMPVTRPSYSISPPPASLSGPPAPKSHSHFLLLPCIPTSLRSFCNSCLSCCHHSSSVVSQPSQTPPCPTPPPPGKP